MPNAKELRNEHIKALFVGRNGSWKSTCAASFPKPLYCFDLDLRIGALRGKDIDYDSYSFKDKDGWWGPKGPDRKLEELQKLAFANKFPYKTILFSSITSATDYFITEAGRWLGTVQNQPGEEDDKGAKRGAIKIGPTPRDPLAPSRQVILPSLRYWNVAFVQTKEVIATLLSFPCNIIVEAHEVSVWDFDNKRWAGKKIQTVPSLQEYIPGKFDECWNFETQDAGVIRGSEVKRWVNFRGELAKTTFRALPDRMDLKDSDNFYDNIMKQYIEREKYVTTL